MRNSLGIITTPRIDIVDFMGTENPYENTEFESVVNAILKSIKSHKLLCVDLHHSSGGYDIFGITNIVYSGNTFTFECGSNSSTIGVKYVFYVNIETKEVSISLVEV